MQFLCYDFSWYFSNLLLKKTTQVTVRCNFIKWCNCVPYRPHVTPYHVKDSSPLTTGTCANLCFITYHYMSCNNWNVKSFRWAHRSGRNVNYGLPTSFTTWAARNDYFTLPPLFHTILYLNNLRAFYTNSANNINHKWTIFTALTHSLQKLKKQQLLKHIQNKRSNFHNFPTAYKRTTFVKLPGKYGTSCTILQSDAVCTFGIHIKFTSSTVLRAMKPRSRFRTMKNRMVLLNWKIFLSNSFARCLNLTFACIPTSI